MDTSESLPFTNSETLNVIKDQSNYGSNSVIENNQTFNPNISAAQLDNFYSQMDSDQQLSDSIEIATYSEESVATEDIIIKDVVDENKVQDAISVLPNDMTTREVELSDQFDHANSSDMTIAMSGIIVDKLSVDVSLLKKKKVCDVLRVQKVLEELSARSAPPEHVHAARYKKQKIANDARMLLLEYARELSSAILEESCLLAKHRKSKELLIPDLKLIFGTCVPTL